MTNKRNRSRNHSVSATPKSELTVALAAAVVMLGAAIGAGLAIRQVRSRAPVQEPNSQAGQPIQRARVPDAESLPRAPETVVQEGPSAPAVDVAPEGLQPEQAQPQAARGPGAWGQDGWNLNLTEEEQARLRQGVTALLQRFQNMSEEKRQAEIARFNAMRERFENMSDEERQQAMGRVQERIEQWAERRLARRSPQQHIPGLTSL